MKALVFIDATFMKVWSHHGVNEGKSEGYVNDDDEGGGCQENSNNMLRFCISLCCVVMCSVCVWL